MIALQILAAGLLLVVADCSRPQPTLVSALSAPSVLQGPRHHVIIDQAKSNLRYSPVPLMLTVYHT